MTDQLTPEEIAALRNLAASAPEIEEVVKDRKFWRRVMQTARTIAAWIVGIGAAFVLLRDMAGDVLHTFRGDR